VDGISQASEPWTGTPGATLAPRRSVWRAIQAPNQYFQGSLGDVQIFDRP